jgi:predicted porin
VICESLLAIAIAAAVPAVASAQVTVGGIMDGGFNSVTTKTATEVTRNQTGGNAAGALASNRLFFRGTEKIGDMTAGFQYELGMDAGGTGDLSTTGGVRMSIVSLAGGFGEIRVGRDYTPIFSLSAATDTSMADNVNIGKSVYLNGAASVTTVRNSGQIMYTLPTMGGLTAKIAVTQRSSDPNASADVESTGGSIVYNAGALMIGAAFNNQNTWTSATAKTKREEMIIGGTYMINKQLSIQAQHGDLQTNGADTYKGTQVGARFNVTPNLMLHASGGSGDGTVGDYTAYKLGLINSLSKRTRLYALYGSDELKTGATKRERSEFAVGINHAF